MKTVKFLIATALLSSTFFACKKEEMNIKSGELVYKSESQNNLGSMTEPATTTGIIKVVFNKMGTMLIEGNPNLEYLLNMYNGSATAINSAKAVFDVKQQETLSIVFDNLGTTIASEIPSVPVGSSIDAFIGNFCKVKPSSPFTLAITKNNLYRNYDEFWKALPEGVNQKFLADIEMLQAELPMNYSIQVSFAENLAPSVIYLDGNGNPQPIQNSQQNCKREGDGWIISVNCFIQNAFGWN